MRSITPEVQLLSPTGIVAKPNYYASLHPYCSGKHLVKDLAQYATNKEFTHLVILTEKQKECNGYVTAASI